MKQTTILWHYPVFKELKFNFQLFEIQVTYSVFVQIKQNILLYCLKKCAYNNFAFSIRKNIKLRSNYIYQSVFEKLKFNLQ